MKNYELIMKLSQYPAGAEIRFECVCDNSEVSIQEDDCIVSKEICFVDAVDESVILS